MWKWRGKITLLKAQEATYNRRGRKEFKVLKIYRYWYFSAHFTITECWNHSHFVVQETHSSSIFYVDPVQCDFKSKWSCINFAGLSWCIAVLITLLITLSGTYEFCLLEAMFDMPLCFAFFLHKAFYFERWWREDPFFLFLWLHYA